MKTRLVQLSVPLSSLTPSRRNPRRVKPAREAHHKLVALIRSQGLLQPLVVRPIEGKPKRYEIIAGNRRLAALREIHKDDGDPKVPCLVREVDAAEADALSLGENFGREPMHPLDEAEAFAKLATGDGKDAKAIASGFGVSEQYVRQRMKLATLGGTIKSAYRQDQIDTATAEAFAAVPEDRQLEVWTELGGHPRHAEHVRNVIANAWIDARHALFDVSALPKAAVSQDLFGDRVLIERKAFMEAQAQALAARRQGMSEEGWAEVVVGRREDVQDRLYAMERPEQEFDEPTTRKLARIIERKQKLEEAAEKIGDADQSRLNRLQARHEALAAQEQEIIDQAPQYVSEATKAAATAFLILDPDGRVHREYRVPRRRGHPSSGNGSPRPESGGESDKPVPPTSDDLSDAQLAATFTHQALAVREALLKSSAARKRVMALVLHESVRSEALAVRREPNGTTLHARSDGFASAAYERLQASRAKLDPLLDRPFVEDCAAYEQFGKLSDSKLTALIDLLIADCITAPTRRRTELVHRLAEELRVSVRDFWRPDAQWLSGYQKQLAHLTTELRGAVHAPAPERKKSDLVESLSKLFADAAEGRIEDKRLAERVNRWLPANLREPEENPMEQRQHNPATRT